jgi:hypothetical protein
MAAPRGSEDRARRPRRPGLLANPRSSRFARQAGLMREAGARFPDALYREAGDPGEIGAAVRELVGEGADIIIVLGGDGTLQAVLDQLPAGSPACPALAVIPCGSTNMTALDLGCGGAPLKGLERLRRRLERRDGLRLVNRPLLRITGKSTPPLQGMFFGAGIITAGVRYFRERVRGRGLTGEAASGIAVLHMLLRALAGAGVAELTPVRAGIAEDGVRAADGVFLLLLATTLDRLLLGSRPYWGAGGAPVHFTAVRAGAGRFWRSLPRIVSGRGRPLEGPDFHSRNLHALELELAGDFVLDGEIHTVEAGGGALRIEAAGPVRFALP